MKKILTLPAAQDRKQWDFLYKILGHLPDDKKEDCYIYYLTSKLSLFISLGFSFLYLLSYFLEKKLDFYFFDIEITKENFVMDLIGSYPFVVSTVLFLTTIPYGFLLMKHNVDFKKLDLLRNNHAGLELINKRPEKIKFFKWGCFLVALIMYGSFALPHMLTKYYFLHHSETLFFILSVFYPWVLSIFSRVIVHTFFVYYQRSRNLLQ